MVTELEKKWEEEEAVEAPEEEAPEGLDETEGESNGEYAQHRHFIHNPLIDPKNDHFEYMCLLESGVRRYIGSIVELDPDTQTCVISYPMEYSEQPRMVKPGSANEAPMYEMSIGLKPMYAPLAGMAQAQFKYTSMYVFRSNRSEDLTLVGEYREVFLGIMAAKANIAKPTQEDISRITLAKS